MWTPDARHIPWALRIEARGCELTAPLFTRAAEAAEETGREPSLLKRLQGLFASKPAMEMRGSRGGQGIALTGSTGQGKRPSDKKMSFEEKPERFEALLINGRITREQYTEARHNLMRTYAAHGK